MRIIRITMKTIRIRFRSPIRVRVKNRIIGVLRVNLTLVCGPKFAGPHHG